MTDATKSEIPTAATESRIACATALRELGHSIVGHAADDRLLDRITAFVSGATRDLDAAPRRSRPVGDMKRRLYDEAPVDGASMDHFPDCIVSGVANPMGIAITCHRDGDDAVASVAFGAAFEGAPGRAHGGVVAAVFDDVMGFVLSIVHTPAYTGRLSVSYLAPTPLGLALEFRARLGRQDGRKLWIDGEATCDGKRFAEAEGLFISIPQDRLDG